MVTGNHKNSLEYQAEVEEKALEIKQYIRAYGPRLLLVGSIALSSCLLLGFLIRKMVEHDPKETKRDGNL